jgi:dienelactone hydrolase
MGVWSRWIAAVVLLAAPAQASVHIVVTPAHPLMDARLGIVVEGLAPRSIIAIDARIRAQDGLWWRSAAQFTADKQGRVDLGAQAPIGGTYHGGDAMGLIWSMAPDAAPRETAHAVFDVPDPTKPVHTIIEMRVDGRVVATADIARSYAAPDVQTRTVGDGLQGILYEPGDPGPHPGVLVIGGSDGGLGAQGTAMLLASHGYAALSLAYFGGKGLPQTLEGIPMEYFQRALAWLRRQPGIGRIAIYGESRGSEPALWTAAMNGHVDAVVARSPSFALWGGVTASHLPGGAAWTRHGAALPYIANSLSAGFVARFVWDKITGTPVRQTPLFLENLRDLRDAEAVTIPVERIRAPLLLLAGKDDQIWPSALMAKRILDRRRGRSGDALIAYDDVGHPIPYAYVPLAGDRAHAPFAVGGTTEGMARAQAEAWPRILAFLAGALKP